MNLLYFTHEKEYGGSSRALVALIKELKDENNIYVVTPFKDAKINSELKNMNINVISCFYSWWQVPVRASFVSRSLFRVAYLFNFISTKILVKKIKKLNIDIIHSNTSAIDIGAKVANKLNIHHVWHFREFTENNLKFIKGKKKSYKFINNNGGNIVYISKAIQDYYSNYIDNSKSRLIYDGICRDYIIKDKQYLEKNTVSFLLAGTLHEGKGQQLVVKAAGKLKKAGYKNIKILFAGGDPIGYSKYLNTLIEENDVRDCVEYLGFVTDLKSLRKNVDVELLCSESEAFGLVTVEGMLAGNPIIGSNSGATAEIIEDNKTGFLYKCNDVDDLASKMKYILDNTSCIKEIGTKAQESAINKFLSDKNAEAVFKYYEEILER